MKGAEEVIERKAIRAILLTRENEILLLRIRQPDTGEWFWITPGGGIEAGETIEEGLRRELREELGLTQFVIGPLVWQRQHTFKWAGKRLCQFEHITSFTSIALNHKCSMLPRLTSWIDFIGGRWMNFPILVNASPLCHWWRL
jgi:8-oxo-dGTP pyrophosphatase MutT (NUDIX family)